MFNVYYTVYIDVYVQILHMQEDTTKKSKCGKRERIKEKLSNHNIFILLTLDRGILNNHFIAAVTALDRDEGAEVCWRVFFHFSFLFTRNLLERAKSNHGSSEGKLTSYQTLDRNSISEAPLD